MKSRIKAEIKKNLLNKIQCDKKKIIKISGEIISVADKVNDNIDNTTEEHNAVLTLPVSTGKRTEKIIQKSNPSLIHKGVDFLNL